MALGFFQKSTKEVYRFSGEKCRILCHMSEDIPSALEEVSQLCAEKGWWAYGYLSYEASEGLDPKLFTQDSLDPLLDFTLYEQREILPFPLDQAESGNQLFLSPPTADLDLQTYQDALEKIKDYLARGDSYQVNFTFPMTGRIHELSPQDQEGQTQLIDLWCRLIQAQACRFGGLYFGQERTILSQSPELFFHKEGTKVNCRPMKGTRANGPDLHPQAVLEDLRANPKDQAENLMIVDMIRNDLGKVAQPGSVKVEELFQVEEYPSVFQMVTPIMAEHHGSLLNLFQALFPCASITGAPKRRTMEIIQELESGPRGVYTGALGWISPQGDALFNVPIRTLILQGQEYQFSVGSGIVWDSIPEKEYEECLVKAVFLQAGYRDFDLSEALTWSPDHGFLYLDQHLQRMARSAESLQESPDPAGWRSFLLDWIQEKGKEGSLPQEAQKVRLSLDARHRLDCQFTGPAKAPEHFHYALAAEPIPQGQDFFLTHKTSKRAIYSSFLSQRPGADQVILFTAEGFLTEGTSANLYLKIDGQWFTPPGDLPLLPGCHRARVLEAGKAKERKLTLEDLKNAEAVAFGNDVRGWVPGRPLVQQYTL
jgi:para-aminobenzoate synthetase/4-amino-4-deoxychorismate lyase